MDTKDLRHAYAVLDLSPPVTGEQLKHRYKDLVRRWHPDRFQSDPEGQAEAEIRLRNINLAYEVVSSSLAYAKGKGGSPEDTASEQEASEQKPVDSAPGSTPWNNTPPKNGHQHNSGGHTFNLSPEQIEAIVESINQGNRLNFLEMTAERWLTVAVAVTSLIVARVVHPANTHRSGDVFILAVEMLVPVFIIWLNANGSPVDSLGRWFVKLFGWLLLLGPAILTPLVWCAHLII